MQDLVECKRCLYKSNHPFGITFIKGICSGCITHEEKNKLDWESIFEELKVLLIKQRPKNKTVYDCVIPVRGDAEDYFVLSQIMNLGLNPLVVSVNDYFFNDIGWHNLHNLITYFDVDSLFYSPNEHIYKELVRTSLRRFSNVLLPSHLLNTSFPVHIARERKIPLIVWGQNQSVEQVGKFSHLNRVEMSRWNRREHDLFGIELDILIGTGAQLNVHHVDYYKYPKTKDLFRGGVRGIYLSNYLRWDPLKQNSDSLKYNFQPQLNTSSFDIYERAGSSVYYGIHDLLKLKNVGYRKVTDHLVREIRHQRISRMEAKKEEIRFSSSKVEIESFFSWLDAKESGYRWFIKHELKAYEGLIGHQKPLKFKQTKIKKLLSNSSLPNNNFIRFGKGIHL